MLIPKSGRLVPPPMIIAILQFELLIPEPESLKDKRRVVRSVKDKLHRDFQCAVAEVGALEDLGVARMGLAIVSNDGKHAGQVLDRITERLRELPDAHLGDCRRELVTGRGGEDGPDGELGGDSGGGFGRPALRAGGADQRGLDAELLRRAMEDPELAALAAAEARSRPTLQDRAQAGAGGRTA